MTTYSFRAYGSEWLNANDRGPWQRRHRLSKEWRQSGGWAARAAQIPKASRVRVVATVLVPDGRRRDPGNYAPTAKAVVDGMVDALVIPDDNARHLDGPDMRLRVDRSVRSPTLDVTVEVLT